MNLQKHYTRAIGIFFTLVAVTLATDYLKFGHRPESWHKIFHVLLGVIVLCYGCSNKNFWRPFCVANGAFFAYAALFGLVFPDFGELDAFNRLDTVLHGFVGISGLLIGLLCKPKEEKQSQASSPTRRRRQSPKNDR